GQLIMLSPPPANAKYVAYKVGDTAKAVFGQLDYALTDALTLTAGLRWTTEERRNNSAQFATMGYRHQGQLSQRSCHGPRLTRAGTPPRLFLRQLTLSTTT
ncbi:MAG: TonB-dependent receptor, partial [Gammaproteobacteria bacterium]|nr:TonB-dependent receptor [Gammaproteobacteria bacterium]